MYRIIQLAPVNEEELSWCFDPSGNVGGYFPFKAHEHISFWLMKLLACQGLKD
jgi:hypothetical protein